MSGKLPQLQEILRSKGYKMTPQRQRILRVFLEEAGSHLSAEDVFGRTKRWGAEIGLATVYRTLELLVGLDILRRVNLDDGCSRYELGDPAFRHHHHHLICTDCGGVTAFADDLLESLERAVAEREGFKISDHHLVFYGICANCQKGSL